MIFWIKPFCARVTVLVTSSLTNLMPRKSVNVPSACELQTQFSKILEKFLKILLVRVGNPKIINIENNHDGFAVQQA